MTQPESTRVSLGLGKKLLLLVVMLVAVLLVAEVAYRSVLVLEGRPQSPAELRRMILEQVSILTEKIPMPERDSVHPAEPDREDHLLLHPFGGFDTVAGIEQTSRGIEYSRSPARSDEFAVLVVGGSVAARFVSLSGEYFLGRLRQDPRFHGKRIRLQKHALGGCKQPQQACMVAYLTAAGYEPNAIINIDGFNEVALGFANGRNGVFPLYPSMRKWGSLTQSAGSSPRILDLLISIREDQLRATAISRNALALGFQYSSLLGRLTLARLKRVRAACWRSSQRYLEWLAERGLKEERASLRGPAFDRSEESILDSIVRCWAESSISIHSMCDARSIPYLHVLQPTLHDEGSKAVTPEERIKGKGNPDWIEGVRAGYPRLRKAGKDLAQRGVPFFDASMLFRGINETLYFDVCHFGGKGTELFGTAVAEAFLESLPSRSIAEPHRSAAADRR